MLVALSHFVLYLISTFYPFIKGLLSVISPVNVRHVCPAFVWLTFQYRLPLHNGRREHQNEDLVMLPKCLSQVLYKMCQLSASQKQEYSVCMTVL